MSNLLYLPPPPPILKTISCDIVPLMSVHDSVWMECATKHYGTSCYTPVSVTPTLRSAALQYLTLPRNLLASWNASWAVYPWVGVTDTSYCTSILLKSNSSVIQVSFSLVILTPFFCRYSVIIIIDELWTDANWYAWPSKMQLISGPVLRMHTITTFLNS